MPILARACLAAARVIDLDDHFVSTEPSHVALFQSHAVRISGAVNLMRIESHLRTEPPKIDSQNSLA